MNNMNMGINMRQGSHNSAMGPPNSGSGFGNFDGQSHDLQQSQFGDYKQ